MYTVLILCRSATLARRAARQLAAAGCPASVVRPPLNLSETGCSYALSVSSRFLPLVEPLLRSGSFACSGKVFKVIDGQYQSVSL